MRRRTSPSRSEPAAGWRALALAALLLGPAAAGARTGLLGEELRAPLPEAGPATWSSATRAAPRPDLSPGVLLAASAPTPAQGGSAAAKEDAPRSQEEAPPASAGAGQATEAAPPPQPSAAQEPPAPPAAPEHPGALDFDLLGAPPPPPPVDDAALRRRRTLLNLHQGAGFGLLALQLATTVVGQLNYDDRFAGGPSTARYQQPHALLAYSTVAAFAATGALALLAPSPPKPREGFDRVTLHEIALFTAAAGMVAEGALGVVTRSREGYLNQPDFAKAHLVIGYVTLAAVAAGVGALVF